jgi:hypothetical protein
MVWQCLSLLVIVRSFNKYCMPNSVDETDDMLCNGPKGMGVLGVSVMKMTALSVKIVTVTLVGKDR